ncbi:MAG: TetR-like C-terminal domain-containing protein [Gemmatimonadales bacterium]
MDLGSQQEGAPGLRARFIDAAHSILREEDPSYKLELRKIAQRAEVSRTAPYLVFGKEREGGGLVALQAAVAADGFRKLAGALRKAGEKAADPEAGLRQIAAAYLRFAAANPRLYRLMFDAELAGKLDLEGLGEERLEAQRVIETAVRRCQAAGVVKAGAAVGIALGAWATMHGFASLMLDDRLAQRSAAAEPEDVARTAADQLLDGLRPP